MSQSQLDNIPTGWVKDDATSYAVDCQSATGINDFLDNKTFYLKQNYPNPFSSSTQISYRLNSSSHITLTVYDLLGRKIQTLVNEFQTTGIHTVDFDASHLCNGHYLYQLTTDNDFVELKKMILKR